MGQEKCRDIELPFAVSAIERPLARPQAVAGQARLEGIIAARYLAKSVAGKAPWMTVL